VTERDIAVRLDRARALFDDVALFVAPSPSIAREFVGLGVEPSKVRVSDYGFVPAPRVERPPADRRLRIGFVGTLVWHKGVHVLLDALRTLPGDDYEVRIHGDVRMFPDYVTGLRRRAEGFPVRFMGAFDESRAAEVYAGLDVVVVPSLWLENSPLVIHEAFMAGIPVVGARIGGIADLINDGTNGRLYDPRSVDELAGVLGSIIGNRAQLDAWAAALPPVKTMAEDALEWERIYAGLVRTAAPVTGGPA
jgi:glycosyltransferase involved in cell wall biosynthesis